MEILTRLRRRRAASAPRTGAAGIGGLPCLLGYHRPSPASRWNAGYGFTRCERCGRDMVRSLLDDWHIPKGHRVVWRSAGSAVRAVGAAGDMPPPPVETPSMSVASLAEAKPDPVDPPLAIEAAADEAQRSAEGFAPFDFSDFDTVPVAPAVVACRDTAPAGDDARAVSPGAGGRLRIPAVK